MVELTEREALEVFVKFYMRRMLPQVTEITVNQLGKEVDLRTEPSSEDMLNAVAVAIRILGNKVETGSNVETAMQVIFWDVEKFISEYVQCEEDIHQSDSVIENALELIEKLYTSIQFSRQPIE